jgi:hypothetical protein
MNHPITIIAICILLHFCSLCLAESEIPDSLIKAFTPTPAEGQTTTPLHNVAKGKRVTSGTKEAPNYAPSANNLTDGDLETRAYPQSFSFEYEIDLQKLSDDQPAGNEGGFNIQQIVLYWGHFGRHFPGTKLENGSWAPAAYKADYVNQYTISYRTIESDEWIPLHSYNALPTLEDAENVEVKREPPSATKDEGTVITTLKYLQLKHVTGLKIKAKGGHWIGIYELMALGTEN